MAIIKELTITVSGSQSRLNKEVYLYLGDGQTTLLITIQEPNYIIGNFENNIVI